MSRSSEMLQTLENNPPWDWPEDAAEVLASILRDGSAPAEERQLAAEFAAETVVVNDEIAEVFLAILANPAESETLRCQAAISLGPALEQSDMDGFDDPDSILITEETFDEICDTMRRLYLDAAVPKDVRRRILEASVRAPLEWHEGAIRAAFESNDPQWVLTAVFCMRFVRGFEEEILASLDSGDPDIHLEAVLAAGSHGLEGAWRHVIRLMEDAKTDKALLLAAIEAVGAIRPEEAPEVLAPFEDSGDPEIADAVEEALAMAEGAGEGDDEE